MNSSERGMKDTYVRSVDNPSPSFHALTELHSGLYETWDHP